LTEEGSSATDSVTDVTDVTDVSQKESSATDSLSSDVTVDRRRKKKDFPHSQFPIPNLKSKISNQYELFC